MIKHLEMTNVGPAPQLKLDFGKRLNLFTGDNGLGKSFLLDIAWWAMTRKWPGELNAKLTANKVALPRNKQQAAQIKYTIDGVSASKPKSIKFKPETQDWPLGQSRPTIPGLVFYALADGSFAVWDPMRNYWSSNDTDNTSRPRAYVFSPKEVWDGLQRSDGTWLCNGLIRDWASWQKEQGEAFTILKTVLQQLSPSPDEPLAPGKLTRISLDDVRDMPTLRMPYNEDVAIAHVSSGMRRIIALAYFLVWCWQEHCQASQLLGKTPETRINFLIDEIESHLHPKWQRRIIPALLDVTQALSNNLSTQFLIATHSPLVMASVEPFFDDKQDAWFDLDLVKSDVLLTQRAFEKHGDVANWLTSEAFDLGSDRPLEYEQLTEEAAKLLDSDSPNRASITDMHQKLVEALGPTDDFLFRWRAICEKKGWLA